jgi:multicopper oxidase
VKAWAYNNQVPGPQIRVREGDRVGVTLTNKLPESTAIHFHGLELPNDQDGVPFITQPPIKPGESYTYEFTVPNAGDARYHAALLKVHTGDDGPRTLADTILAQTPGHLFGYVVRGTVARFRKDKIELNRAYAGFLKRYDPEMKLARPEYAEHRTSLDDFRRAALNTK